jgi:hypothetical protein
MAQDAVVASPAAYEIVPKSPYEARIVALQAQDLIIASPTIESIGTVSAYEDVVTGAANLGER